jgi:hypothetical protein
MTVKKMISIPDDLDAMINEYNEKHRFKKLHISEICQEAIYNEICGITGAMPDTIKEIAPEEQIENETAMPQEQIQSVNLEERIQENEEQIENEPAVPQVINLEKRIQKTGICESCGKEFTKSRSNNIYCSDKCKNMVSNEKRDGKRKERKKTS